METFMNCDNSVTLSPVASNCVNSVCSNNCIKQCLSFLLQGLSSLGYNSSRFPLTFSKENDPQALIGVIQRVFTIISECKKAHDDLEEKNQTLLADLKHAFNVETRNQSALQQSERQVLTLKEKERQMLIKVKNIQCELKTEKDEIKRLKAVLQQKAAQYLHENRRKENELVQMSEQLYKALNERRQNRPEMKVVNVLTRTDGSRGKWNTETIAKKQESDFMKTVMQGYETRNSELVEENVALKETLANFLHEVELLTENVRNEEDNDNDSLAGSSSTHQSSSKSSDHESCVSSLKESSYFQTHFQNIKQHVNHLFLEKLGLAKEILSSKKDAKDENQECLLVAKQELEKEISKLKITLSEKEKIVDEQQLMLESAATVQNTDNPYLKDSFILEEKERFRKEREFFLEQRSNFERERKAFTEAAIRLGKEQRDFEERKNNLFLLHGISCETPTQRRKPSRRSLPSTPELYHVLGLSNAE